MRSDISLHAALALLGPLPELHLSNQHWFHPSFSPGLALGKPTQLLGHASKGRLLLLELAELLLERDLSYLKGHANVFYLKKLSRGVI